MHSIGCGWRKSPWASTGRALLLGGGCGVFDGNQYGCPVGNDTRAPGSVCEDWWKGACMGGSSQFVINFSQALTTELPLGSQQDVAWSTVGYHWGVTRTDYVNCHQKERKA